MVNLGAILAIIPARGGSKRLPRKNLLPLGGKPIISWTIDAAITSQRFAEIVVTSEDNEILMLANQPGVTLHRRGAELATDNASTVDVMLDVIGCLESAGRQFGTCVLLQPTSPFRNSVDIGGALDMYARGSGETVISVSELGVPVGWCGSVDAEGYLNDFKSLERDESARAAAYRLNGAIYVFNCQRFKSERRYQTERNLAFVVPQERAIDIDTERDLRQCEALLSSRASM